jgi:hypothetical protein
MQAAARYTFTEPAQALIDRLLKGQAEDKLAEKRTKQFGCTGALVAFGSFFSFAFIGPWGALLLVTGIVLIVLAVKASKHDVEDRKIGTALRLVKILRADIPAAEPIELTVDFREPSKVKDLIVQKPVPTGKEGITFYEQPWLQLKASLADGSVVELGATDQVRNRKYWKKRGGKSKLKHQQRIATTVTVDLKLGKPYREDLPYEQALRAFPPPPSLLVSKTAQQGKRVRAELESPAMVKIISGRNPPGYKPPELVGADAILGALRWVYRGIAAVQKTA